MGFEENVEELRGMSAYERNQKLRDRYANDSKYRDAVLQRGRKSYHKNIAKIHEKDREWRKKVKRQAMEMLGGIKCSWPAGCGCEEIDVLQFDHVNGGGEKERKRGIKGGYTLASLIVQERYPKANVRVLCQLHNGLAYLEHKYPDLKGRFKVIYER